MEYSYEPLIHDAWDNNPKDRYLGWQRYERGKEVSCSMPPELIECCYVLFGLGACHLMSLDERKSYYKGGGGMN